MKIQGLAIIFIIIILPITIVIGEYASTQIEISRLEQLYDSRLITATDDALKAFQINTFNGAYSDIANKKISSIEASANAFYNSMESSFGLQGYSKDELKMYVPALVYTMYDGYYIYSPYTNIAELNEKEEPEDDLSEDYVQTELNINLNSENLDYGFKPYVYYSCRYYIDEDNDFIINYSLDNYITVQGIVNGKYEYKSGYLITIANDSEIGLYYNGEKYYYYGVEISLEAPLQDYLIENDGSINPYSYIKLNGTKYYLDEDEEYIFYLSGGNKVEQVSSNVKNEEYTQYKNKIQENTAAISYYKNAYEFTNWVNQNLNKLTFKHAQEVPYTENETDKIFVVDDKDNPIEFSSSSFNSHRKEVIRYSIESNLSVAIANFNNYSNSTNFQMPKLKDTEWELLQNEVSIISFLQGLNLGGKIYNGYTVVTNSKTEEVVKEERIYITTSDGYYHKINDNHLKNDDVVDIVTGGALDLDFEIRKNGSTGQFYIQKNELGCYTSIVGQENVDNTYDTIYEYLNKTANIDNKIKQIYYTALGRERFGMFKVENPSTVPTIIANMYTSNIEQQYLTASNLTADAYGKYVTNYKSLNETGRGASIKWRIFHSDGDNIFLIADDYIQRDYVPIGQGTNEVSIGTGNFLRGFSIIPLESSATYITRDIALNLLNQYTEKGYTESSTNINIKATAYLLDTDKWFGFRDNKGLADYAIGAPTIELFRDSYNVTHERKIETTVYENGYKFKWNNSSKFEPIISGLDSSGNLYVINDNTNADGMWIASPSAHMNNALVTVNNDGIVAYYKNNDTNCGSRPVVCLNSNVRLQKQSNGDYKIIE